MRGKWRGASRSADVGRAAGRSRRRCVAVDLERDLPTAAQDPAALRRASAAARREPVDDPAFLELFGDGSTEAL